MLFIELLKHEGNGKTVPSFCMFMVFSCVVKVFMVSNPDSVPVFRERAEAPAVA